MENQLLNEVLSLRQASRQMVRELRFLQNLYPEGGVPHSLAHALMEIEIWGELNQQDLAQKLNLNKSTASRIVSQLLSRAWVVTRTAPEDGRSVLVSLTPKGKKQLGQIHGPSNARVGAALSTLSEEQRDLVIRGMNLYAESLRKTRLRAEVEIRPIRPRDNVELAKVIRQCLAEFNAGGPGYATGDPDFERLYEAYSQSGSAYFVVTKDRKIVGGAGVAPLKGSDGSTCEFQKMYLLPHVRGYGLGKHLLDMSVSTARELKYRKVYLETLNPMRAARNMYEKSGFKRLETPLGKTGHYACDAWYVRDL